MKIIKQHFFLPKVYFSSLRNEKQIKCILKNGMLSLG